MLPTATTSFPNSSPDVVVLPELAYRLLVLVVTPGVSHLASTNVDSEYMSADPTLNVFNVNMVAVK